MAGVGGDREYGLFTKVRGCGKGPSWIYPCQSLKGFCGKVREVGKSSLFWGAFLLFFFLLPHITEVSGRVKVTGFARSEGPSSALRPVDAYPALRSGCSWYSGLRDGSGEGPLRCSQWGSSFGG